jgi:hypothetical protein
VTTVLTYSIQVRDARLARGLSQFALWRRLVETFGENAICLQTLKNVEVERGEPEARTKSQLARVLPETR